MKILIAGAGETGFHLAKLLSSERQDITVVDINNEVLEYASNNLDVNTVRGDSSSIELLKSIDTSRSQLFLAVTASEKTNLLSAILAKKLGASQTIARVNNAEFLKPKQKTLFKSLGVDHLISPDVLAAQEIKRLLDQGAVTDVYHFEEGKISLMGITVDDDTTILNKSIKEIPTHNGEPLINPVAILRRDTTILPRDNTVIHRGDHVYFFSTKERRQKALEQLGKSTKKVKNIMILGGKGLGYQTARLLEKDYRVKLVEEEKQTCQQLINDLSDCLVIKANPGNIDLLKEEQLEEMDVLISTTPNSETNIITCLLSQQLGVKKTIALVDNANYIKISQNIGVDTLINKKLIAANNIFRFVRKGNIEAITSLHGVDAEIIEYIITKDNQLTRKPLRELPIPKSALIGGVIRNEQSLIPNGDFIFQKEDRAIVFAQPEAIHTVESLFR